MSQAEYTLEPLSHIGLMALAGIRSGIAVAAPEDSTCLDVGCGNGFNLLPMAYHLPNSRFVGLDASPENIDQAAANAERLGCTNTRFLVDFSKCRELLGGGADYVIVCGILSYIAAEERSRLLRDVKSLLKENGIVFVSYNSSTGWTLRLHLRQLVRKVLRETKTSRDTVETVQEIINVLAASKLPVRDRLAALTRAEVEFCRGLSDHQLTRLFLSPVCEAFDAREIRDLVAQAGFSLLEQPRDSLAFVAEAEETSKQLYQLTGDATLARDLLDFLRTPQRGAGYLCHSEVLGTMDSRNIASSPLWYAANLGSSDRSVALDPGIEVGFKSALGKLVRSDRSLEKAALETLQKEWPNGMTLKELIAKSVKLVEASLGATVDLSPEDKDALVNGLRALERQGVVSVRTVHLEATSQVVEKPAVFGVNRWQAEIGNVLCSPYHDLVIIDDFSRAMIQLMDGSHNVAEITKEMKAVLDSGQLGFAGDRDQKINLDEFVSSAVQKGVSEVTRTGLVRGEERDELARRGSVIELG